MEKLPQPPSSDLFQVDSPTVLTSYSPESPLPTDLDTPSPSTESDVEELNELESRKKLRRRRIWMSVMWSLLAVVSLAFFTYLKIPEARLKALVQGYLNVALAERGASVTSEKSEISLLFGLKYKMEGVRILLPSPYPPVKLDSLSVKPSLLRIPFGQYGASMQLIQGDARMDAFVSLSPRADNPERVRIEFNGKNLDGGKLGILSLFGGPAGSFLFDGQGDLDLRLADFTQTEGSVSLHLKKIVLDSQRYAGFSLPKLQISEANIQFTFEGGKLKIQVAEVGKTAADDIKANVTGEAELGKSWAATRLNFKAKFQISPKILQAFSLIDSLLTQGKTGEGQYHYLISGTPAVPNFSAAQ